MQKVTTLFDAAAGTLPACGFWRLYGKLMHEFGGIAV